MENKKETILIVCSNIDDLKLKREKLIKEHRVKGRTLEWSDSAAESTTKLFVFKVILMPTSVIDSLKGYDKVKPNHLLDEIRGFVKEFKQICGDNTDIEDNTSPEDTGCDERDERDEDDKMDADTNKEQKND